MPLNQKKWLAMGREKRPNLNSRGSLETVLKVSSKYLRVMDEMDSKEAALHSSLLLNMLPQDKSGPL